MTLLERYMPHDWESIVLPENVKKNLQNIQKQKGYRLLLYGSPGNGKCLGKDTHILMYDGSIKKVQDIKIGDKVMGPDSQSRTVLSTTTGRERMLKVIPNKGMAWTCNESHILSLLPAGSWRYGSPLPTDKIEDIEIKEVEKHLTKNYRKKLFRVPIEFDYSNNSDMYRMGSEVMSVKFIQHFVLCCNREQRLQFIAGLLDNIRFNIRLKDNTLSLVMMHDELFDEIVFVFRSLGFCVTTNSFKETGNIFYHRMYVSGDFTIIPSKKRDMKSLFRLQRKNPLVTGFKIEDLGEGDYYGFTLTGDGRFLLGDFTVTHNTSTAKIMSSGDSVKYLSGSNDFNIETLRGKVYSFASNKSVTGQRKTIIIDEFENIRDNIQDAFKIILDQAKSTNFIFCTNEVEKVNNAVRSRCTNFEYDFINSNYEEFFKLYSAWLGRIVREILKDRGVEYNKEIHGPALLEIRKNNFPDFRHTLVTLQSIIDSEQDITVESVSKCSVNTKQLIDLYQLIENRELSPEKIYAEVCKYAGGEKDALISLGEPFFKYLNDKGMFEKTILCASIVSKYCDSFTTSINKFVTFFSCITELRTVFR